jgi:putative spermidine/putrescine transport system substrate-binding protein
MVTVAAAFAAGCGSDDDEKPGAQKEVGKGEGALRIIAGARYAEEGSPDPKVDWVTPFEKDTGCKVTVETANTSEEMVTMMRTGKYDGVSASGDATLRLIASKDVAPVNTDLVPNYKDIFPALKDQPFNSVDGQMYGIPQGRGANLLMWNADAVTPAPTSWSAVFDPAQASRYKGKVTAYDNAIYIADAALYLSKHNPELGIKNIYELDQKQFDTAIDLLKDQRENIGEYWADHTEERAAFASGDSVIGTTWQLIANLLRGAKKPTNVKVTLPSEGTTGWSDTWMISSTAQHPNCMYKWMNHIVSPQTNAEVAERLGEAPSNEKSCQITADKDHCDTFHAADERYFDQVRYWTTPKKDCGDDRGDVCKEYSEWVQGWAEVKG